MSTTIPERIKAARIAVGLTQKQVGEALGYASSAAQAVVGNWESGKNPVPDTKKRQLAQLLNLTLDDLIP